MGAAVIGAHVGVLGREGHQAPLRQAGAGTAQRALGPGEPLRQRLAGRPNDALTARMRTGPRLGEKKGGLAGPAALDGPHGHREPAVRVA